DGPRLSAPAARVRQGRGAAGAQAPGQVQRRWSRRLGRPALWQRRRAAPGRLALARLLRRLGHGLLPVPVRTAAWLARIPSSDARVVSGDRGDGTAFSGRRAMGPFAPRAAVAGRGAGGTADRRWPWSGAGALL